MAAKRGTLRVPQPLEWVKVTSKNPLQRWECIDM